MTRKTKVITTASAAAALVLLSVSLKGISGSLESQNMAERWQGGDLRYSQVSVFYPEGRGSYDISETEHFRTDIAEKVKTGSFRPENEDAQVWTCGYSSVITRADVSLYSDTTGKITPVPSQFSITGTGGDFFEFHPFKILSGGLIYDDELRNDRAVLDEQAAWNIFSSTDVAGMKFLINSTEFEVAGVIRAEDSSAVRKAYPDAPLIYVHYSALEEAGLNTSLLCCEAVLPNPVSNYARNMVLETYGVNTMTEAPDGKDPEKSVPVVVTENTGRYSVPNLWKGLKSFDMLSVSDRSIAWPYWENAARINYVRAVILFLLALLAGSYLLITALAEGARLWLHRTWHLKDFLEDMMYKYTYKKRTSDYITADVQDETDGRFEQ